MSVASTLYWPPITLGTPKSVIDQREDDEDRADQAVARARERDRQKVRDGRWRAAPRPPRRAARRRVASAVVRMIERVREGPEHLADDDADRPVDRGAEQQRPWPGPGCRTGRRGRSPGSSEGARSGICAIEPEQAAAGHAGAGQAHRRRRRPASTQITVLTIRDRRRVADRGRTAPGCRNRRESWRARRSCRRRAWNAFDSSAQSGSSDGERRASAIRAQQQRRAA